MHAMHIYDNSKRTTHRDMRIVSVANFGQRGNLAFQALHATSYVYYMRAQWVAFLQLTL